MDAVPVLPTQQFAVTLDAQTWNMVLMAMGKATYEVAAPLIGAISQQLQQQAGQAPQPGNGLAHDGIGLPPN